MIRNGFLALLPALFPKSDPATPKPPFHRSRPGCSTTPWALFLGVMFVLSAAAERPPNIIVVMADDLGYGDLGVHGCKDIPTPHLDSIARHGVRCSSAYVTSPVCSPSRAGLLTGRYQQRFGHEFNPSPPTLPGSAELGLPLTEQTLAQKLKQAGYVTGLIGKWHLGHSPKFHPQQRGFDEFFGFLQGGHSYLHTRSNSHNPILSGTNRVGPAGYLTDAFTREAVSFMARYAHQPFFLYLSYNAVHTPMQRGGRHARPFRHIAHPRRRLYASMLFSLDAGVGAVLRQLQASRLETDTILFFLGDNGGPSAANASRNYPFSGGKGHLREGGIRVPLLVQWPGHLPAGRVFDDPVMAPDIFTTAVAAAGLELSTNAALDGVNLLPYLTGANAHPPHEMLFWRFGDAAAVRRGPWKLLREPATPAARLFHLATDLTESHDLAEQNPAVVAELETLWAEWNQQLPPPRWVFTGSGELADDP